MCKLRSELSPNIQAKVRSQEEVIIESAIHLWRFIVLSTTCVCRFVSHCPSAVSF